MRAWAALLALVLSSGCSVASLEDQGIDSAHNNCSSDADCGEGKCDATLGVCYAPEGQFSKVLFEVTPPSNAGEFAGVEFLLNQDVSMTGGELDLALGLVAKVKGTAEPTKGGYSNCETAYGSFKSATAPVKLTFTPSARLLGLSAEKYVAKTTKNDAKGVYEFEAIVPPDEYDVYVEPDSESDGYVSGACTVVPQLFRVVIESGAPQLSLKLQPPSALELDVLWPKSSNQTQALAGWEVDVIDPATGRLLSAPADLAFATAPSVADPLNEHFTAVVEYATATGGAGPGTELVRIKPPTGLLAPTLVIERAALEALTPGKARVDQLQQLPSSVVLDELKLVDPDGDTHEALTATVRFLSTKLDIEALPGTQAFFERTEDAVGGVVKGVELLPGEYEVYVAPNAGSGFATTKTKLTVGASGSSLQGGKTVMLERVSDVGGSVATPSGSAPAIGATVYATPSPVAPVPLQAAVGAKPFEPLSSTGIVGENGQFSLQADPGTFDFSSRPADGTGFAWLVRPNVEVQSGLHDLGEMTLPLPVIYQGQVTVPGGGAPVVVPGALVRAYLYLDAAGYTEDRAGASAVVQVAETRAANDGSFQLFLPAHLN